MKSSPLAVPMSRLRPSSPTAPSAARSMTISWRRFRPRIPSLAAVVGITRRVRVTWGPGETSYQKRWERARKTVEGSLAVHVLSKM